MALLFILILLNVSFFVVDGGTVIMVNNKAQKGMENAIRCHVLNTWTGYKSQYKMICFQCNGKQRSVVIYEGEEVVDSAWVRSCGHFKVAQSVTILPKESSLHRIEYEMTAVGCRTMSYYKDNISSRPCYELHRTRRISHAYLNGWHLKSISWQMGVIRDFIPRLPDSCSSIRRWKSALKPVTMRCYNCDSGYVVVLYDDFDKMEAFHVGSCRSPYLEDSIDIIYPSRKAPSQVRVQYRMYTDKCVYRIYEWDNGPFKVTHQKDCIYKAVYNIKSMAGYRNGWKIE